MADAFVISTVGGRGIDTALTNPELAAIAELDTTPFGRALLELANAAALKAALDLVEGDIPAEIARTTEVQTAITDALTDLVGTAPATLDKIGELADAIGDDPNFATTVANLVAGVQTDVDDLRTDFEGHLSDPTAAHAASAIASTAVSTFVPETTVQQVFDNWGVWWWIAKNWIAGKYSSMAKGGLLLGSGEVESTIALAPGANGQSLVTDSAAPSGLKWEDRQTSWVRSILTYFGPNVITGGGAWVTTALPTYGYNSQGIGATPHAAIWRVDIAPGTWTLDFLMVKTNNSGHAKIEYSVDGGSNWITVAASVDLYNATTIYGPLSYTGLVIPAGATRIDIRVSALGTKNASSTNYYNLFNSMTLRRTA